MQAIRKWKDLAVERTGTSKGSKAFAAEGIAVISGHAHFLSPYEVSIGHQRLTAKKFLIASGTTDIVPPIEGLKKAGFITYRKAINLTKLPRSLFVIGGGAIGTEFTHLFNRLDVEVTQAEFTPRILNREEPEASELMKALLEMRGVNVLTNTEVFKVEVDRQKKVVHYRQDGVEGSVRVDEILLAAGKKPNLDLGLENAGVVFNKRGIETNTMMQTSTKHIYAAGDVVGPYAFTHMASYQSRIAAHNMFSNEKIVTKYHAVPRVTFTDPEVASVGITEAEARDKGLKIRVNAIPTSVIGRANTSNESAGFVKVVAAKNGVLLGACIVAPRAGEMMQELALAIHMGLKARDVAATIHAFPTWSEAVRIACAGLK
jgi:dihydrolipoamide dehydrogenase